MAPPSPARVLVGLLLGGAGAGLLSLGLMRAPLVAGAAGPLPADIVADFAGGVLLLLGLVVAMSQQRPRGPPVAVPAHVAFSARAPPAPVVVPPRRADPAASSDSAPLDEHHKALAQLDEEIRAVTRRINKASVMLATGKLSNEGYRTYVEGLKRQRGELEVSRVQLELRKRQS